MSTVLAEPTLNVDDFIKNERVNGRLYYDPEIYQLELERIWHKVWVYVGHETEVPNSGDYINRQVGEQPVIMVRGDDGQVRVFFNRCRHRGLIMCHAERGGGDNLYCRYHGWTYETTGELKVATLDEAYEGALDKQEFALTPLPRVDSYRGLVFASVSPEGISLKQHLGQATGYLDDIMDQSPTGEMDLDSGINKLRCRGNWKMVPENSLEGNYHGLFVHKFAFDLFDRRNGQDRSVHREDSILFLPGGHMVEDFRRQIRLTRIKPKKTPAQQTYADQMVKAYGKERAESIIDGTTPMIYIFPNLVFIQTHFRRLQPASVAETLITYQPALLKGVPPEINEGILRWHEGSFGPAGLLAGDDVQIMERTQVGVQAQGDEWMYIGRGMHRESLSDDGVTRGRTTDENHLRGMWSHYSALMAQN